MTERMKRNLKLKGQMTIWEQFGLIGASLGLAFLSVSLPFFNNLATSLQSQNLYIGYAFTKGQAPYIDLFTRDGFLYHGLSGLANYFGGSYWLIPLQAICFYLSGIYLHKISLYLTQKSMIARLVLVAFFLLNLVLGFGGLYPMQFATPFIFMGIWFLLTYFEVGRKDELFIIYGLVQSLSLFFEPRTLLFWLLAFLVLTISNLKRSQLWRGLYQTLSMIFGSLIVTYSLGYLILNMQLLMPYLRQTMLSNFNNLQFNAQGGWWGSAILVLVFLASGFAPVLANFWSSGRGGKFKNIKTLLKVSGLIYLVWVVLSQNRDFYDLLMIVPFFLPLTALWLNDRRGEEQEQVSARRQARQRGHLVQDYLKSSFYLPLALLIVGIARPFVTYMAELPQYQDSQLISTYLAKKMKPNEKIYVWDDSAKIYVESSALSASQFALPTLNTVSSDNHELLLDELLQFQATYVVFNPALPIPEEVEKDLLGDYEEIKLSGLKTMKLYFKLD